MADIRVNTTITIPISEYVKDMTIEDFCELCCEAAEELNKHFTNRNKAAASMAEHLSENACRFLAEVVTHHFGRNIS